MGEVGEVDLRAMMEDLRRHDSDAMYFELNREPEPGRTFSSDGLAQIARTIGVFLGARVMAHWDKRGDTKVMPGPSRLKIHVIVSIDGAEPVVVDESSFPWFVTSDNRAGGFHD
jgi:hypothetical protein